MTDTMWGLLGLLGIVVVVIGNALRARRTGDIGCLGHFFVSREEMTTVEMILNRSGIVLFFVGVTVSIAL